MRVRTTKKAHEKLFKKQPWPVKGELTRKQAKTRVAVIVDGRKFEAYYPNDFWEPDEEVKQ